MLAPLFSALHALAVDDASGGGGLSLHLLAAFHVQCVSQVIAVVLRPVLALDVAAILDAAGGRNAAGSQGRTTNPGRYAGKTGVNNVVPAIKSLLSMLPVWTPGGELLIRPMTGSGATPIVPKNGLFTGTTTPVATRADFVWRWIGMTRRKKLGSSSGSALIRATIFSFFGFFEIVNEIAGRGAAVPRPSFPFSDFSRLLAAALRSRVHLFLFQVFRDRWRRRCGPATIFSFFRFFEIAIPSERSRPRPRAVRRELLRRFRD